MADLPNSGQPDPSLPPPGLDPEMYTIDNLGDLMNQRGLNAENYEIPEPPQELFDPNRPQLNTPDAIQGAVDQMHLNHGSSVVNPVKAGKEQYFGAGMDDHFYERYYEHPKFDQLGFSPFRDNETLYNENSSGWDDFGRAWGQFWNLAGLAFTDAAGFGDQSDRETAAGFEKAMAIGQSSRGGLGGFATNLFLNSGYTIGIIGEVVMEEIALAGATFLTGGATAPLMAARAARASSKLHKGYTVGKNVLKSLQNLKDVNRARAYWRNARRGAGNFLNPLQGTYDFYKSRKKLDALNGLAKTSLGVGSFYRDVRNARLAWGEAGLEAGMVENQLLKELYSDFETSNGRTPNKEEAEALNQQALAAAKTAHMQNSLLIFYSNKIVFDNLFKGFSPIRRFTEDVVEQGVAGKILFNKKALTDPFKIRERGVKGFLKAAVSPRTYAKRGLNYFNANIAEGLQETGQEVIADATMAYYKDHYSPDSNHYLDVFKGGYMASVADNLQKQVSPEGLEIFMSGFLMGGMVQPIMKAPGAFKGGYRRVFNAKEYQEQKQASEKILNERVNMLNDLYANPELYFHPDLENSTNQVAYNKGMKEASKKGDAQTFYDLKDASGFDHVYTALRMGRIDTFIERMEDMKTLNQEEAAEAFGEKAQDLESFHKSLDHSIAMAKRIESRFELAKKKFQNPFNANQFKYMSGEWIAEANNKIAWDNAVKQMVFMQESFDRNLERMTDVMGTAKEDTQLKNIAASDFNVLFNFTELTREIELLKEELQNLGPEDQILEKQQKVFHKQKKQKLEKLEKFSAAMEALVSYVPKSTPTQVALNQAQEDLQAELTSEFKSDTVVAELEATINKLQAQVEKEKAAQKDGPVSKAIDIDSGSEKKLVKQAYDTYEDYLRHLAKDKDHVFTENVQTSFQKLVDYYKLNSRAEKLTSAINTLIDPGAFTRLAARAAEVQSHYLDNRKAQIEQYLRAFEEAREDNDLLQKLYDEGMFFDVEELVKLKEEGVLPSSFYDVKTKEPILANSPEYRKAIQIVREFVENVKDIEITGRDENYGREFSGVRREKINNDERTYDDLAEQYGFDPAATSSKVPLKQVLQTVIDSNYATQSEKALARQYLRIASDEETVEFRNDHHIPGTYSRTEQTIIDARYNSHDYKGGISPIEYVILHEETHRRTMDAINDDKVFRDELQQIYEAAINYSNTAEAKARWGAKPLYGLKNLDELTTETMSNPRFQEFLAEVPFEGSTQDSAWGKFVDAVIEHLKKIFGRNVNNSALNEAINVITAKIDIEFGAPLQEGTTRKEIEDARKKEIQPIVDEIKEIEKELEEIEDQEITPSLEDFEQGKREFLDAVSKIPGAERVPWSFLLAEPTQTFESASRQAERLIGQAIPLTETQKRHDQTIKGRKEQEKEEVEFLRQTSLDQVLKESGITLEQSYTIEELDAILDKMEMTQEVREVFMLVKQAAKDLGVTVKFSEKDTRPGVRGFYHLQTHSIKIDPRILPERAGAAQTVVHEIIHGVTNYVIYNVDGTQRSGVPTLGYRRLSKAQIDAVTNLRKILNAIKDNPEISDEYGVTDMDELLAELTNPRFVEKLKSIRFENSNLLERLVSAIAQILGISTSAYDLVREQLETIIAEPNLGVLDITGTSYVKGIQPQYSLERKTHLENRLTELKGKLERINARYDAQLKALDEGKKNIEGAEPAGKGLPRLSRSTPVEEIAANHPELAQTLLESYKAENQRRAELDDDTVRPFDEGFADKTDEEILASDEFADYFQGPWTAIGEALAEYNKATGRTTTPIPEPTAAEEAPATVTQEMQKQLLALGYNPRDYMHVPAIAQALIDQGISKAERDATAAQIIKETQDILDEERQAVRDYMSQLIEDSVNMEELETAEAIILGMMGDPSLQTTAGLTGTEVNTLIENKKKALALSFTFDDILPGEVVILNDRRGTKVVIEKKTAKTLTAVDVTDPLKRFRIGAAKVQERIKYRYSPEMKDIEIEPEREITEQEEDLSNESTEQASDNLEATREIVEKAKKGGALDWFDNLNEC